MFHLETSTLTQLLATYGYLARPCCSWLPSRRGRAINSP
jgi:hypothetical protein